MIFPEITLEEWLEKYPELQILTKKCDNCNKDITANKPFITNGYVGLSSDKCICGKNKHDCMYYITNSEETFGFWSDKVY